MNSDEMQKNNLPFSENFISNIYYQIML